jgi:hypothetical protein
MLTGEPRFIDSGPRLRSAALPATQVVPVADFIPAVESQPPVVNECERVSATFLVPACHQADLILHQTSSKHGVPQTNPSHVSPIQRARTPAIHSSTRRKSLLESYTKTLAKPVSQVCFPWPEAFEADHCACLMHCFLEKTAPMVRSLISLM